jgi:hypothetical protein
MNHLPRLVGERREIQEVDFESMILDRVSCVLRKPAVAKA